MSVKTYIDEETGMAIQEISGALSAPEILEAQRELYLRMNFDPRKPCLWDATHGDVAGSMSGVEMREAASESEELWAKMMGGKTAILVNTEGDFGMGRMYEMLADRMPRKLGVFRSRDEAVAWLTSSSDDAP